MRKEKGAGMYANYKTAIIDGVKTFVEMQKKNIWRVRVQSDYSEMIVKWC